MTEKFNPALLIIDLQEDFLPPTGSLACKGGREIIPTILSLLDLEKYGWKAVIATKDWHPEGHISFASTNHQAPYTTKEFTSPDPKSDKKMTQVLWPDHCIQTTFGSAFPEEFAIVFNKMVEDQPVPTKLVKKGYLQDREYYSCFMDVWKLHHTECEQFLRDNDITHVYTVGIAYDYCVVNSSIDAADLGFKTCVIKDATRAVDSGNDKKTEQTYKEHGVGIISMASPELAKVLKP